MSSNNRWRRITAAVAAAAVVVPFAASATATAAPSAETTKWVQADFLQRTFGVPANTALEAVTYDRFQNLLHRSGNFAILIGDPATDPSFKARAAAVDAAARAAGVQKVYWFNPNLSGGTKVGAVTVPNLDIRASDDFKLIATSKTKFKDAWQNLVYLGLGNGVSATATFPNLQEQTVVTTTGPAGTVNDSTDPIYDYSAGAPANVKDSYFLVYNNDATTGGGAKDKVVSWVNLSKDGAADTKIATAIAGKQFATVDQFSWWKEEANNRHANGSNASQGSNVPVLTDADKAAADGGWRVNQITYAELIDLLDHSTDADAAILFGGTWCPNTRAVLPFVNKEAQKNNVTVYNFDTVLDGGKVAGSPTAGINTANPLQTRNPEPAADAQGNGRFASFLYGELISQYLGNFITEYLPNESNAITYFPAGDTTKPLASKARLQVPYLFAYKAKGGTGPQNGVTRQWIQKGSRVTTPVVRTHTEYMSNWWYTNPQPNLSGITLPAGAAAWTKINENLANLTWKTPVSAVVPSRATIADAADYLVAADTTNVSVNAVTGQPQVSTGNQTPINPTALANALAALGAAAPTTLEGAKAAWLANQADTNLRTVVGAWLTADTRKGTLTDRFGTPTTPNSILGGAAAKRALEVFFGGLPGGPRHTTRTVTANAVTAPAAPSVSVAIANTAGRTATGDVAVSVKSGATEVASGTGALSGNAASVALPAIAAGSYEFTLTYAGDELVDGFTETGTLTVNPAPVVDPPAPPVVSPGPTPTPTPVATPTAKAKVSKVAGALSKAPTSKKSGKYKVTISTAKGQAKATGKVTIKLTKGKTTKTVTGTLKNGTVTVTVPKLAKGTWKVAITWPGDGTYQSGKATGTSIKVKK